MSSSDDEFETIDEYIKTFPAEIQETLEELRRTIREAAPNAEETISYQIPTFEQEGIVVHFAAFDEHIGFYPTPSGMTAFEEELSTYERGKGSVKFPLDEPLPFDLVREITEYRVEENVGDPD
ncbi:iron chaperone [Natrinema soli]|uniref:Iron chaperone n=1 Tax=Natrinema soli TaxID=1930624 RepID=A0ABD5SN51_9EURY|nr:DUF1801 domain-containing protein [Natrinema soli]